MEDSLTRADLGPDPIKIITIVIDGDLAPVVDVGGVPLHQAAQIMRESYGIIDEMLIALPIIKNGDATIFQESDSYWIDDYEDYED